MTCLDQLKVHAYFDGEVDALAAADIDQHIEKCAECGELIQQLRQTRAAIRGNATRHAAAPLLRRQIMASLDREDLSPRTAPPAALSAPSLWRTRAFWSGAFGGVGCTAVAALCAFLLVAPLPQEPLLDDLVTAHVRSLMPAHLIDVESTNEHTVKPWFAGHADVSPAVADFSDQGYRLIGGRADYFRHQRPAVSVYQHGAHVINVFSWIDERGPLPRDTTRNGYRMAFWRTGNVVNCAISDTGWDELLTLERRIRDLPE